MTCTRRTTLAAVAAALCAALGACVVTTPTQPSERPAGPPRGPQAGGGCAAGADRIGILVVASQGVFVNNAQAGTGRVVCEGDDLRTDGTGVADVLLEGDREGDAIHLAENTDPRLRWTAGRCVSVEGFDRGTINVTSRRLCMVVRTRDVLLYHPAASRTQYVVRPGQATEVKPYQGQAPVRLQPTSDIDVRRLSTAQLLARSAPPQAQPQPLSLNVYQADVMVQPPRRLTPDEIRTIRAVPLRTPLIQYQQIQNQPVIR